MSGDCRVHSYLLLVTATILMMRAAMEQKKWALHPPVMIESPRRRSANGERPSLRGEAMHCSCI